MTRNKDSSAVMQYTLQKCRGGLGLSGLRYPRMAILPVFFAIKKLAVAFLGDIKKVTSSSFAQFQAALRQPVLQKVYLQALCKLGYDEILACARGGGASAYAKTLQGHVTDIVFHNLKLTYANVWEREFLRQAANDPCTGCPLPSPR